MVELSSNNSCQTAVSALNIMVWSVTWQKIEKVTLVAFLEGILAYDPPTFLLYNTLNSRLEGRN